MLIKARKQLLLTLLVAISLMALASTLAAAAGDTTLVSTNSSGVLGNSFSRDPSISSDGRFVAFHSAAINLVPDDTNGTWDVFVHDRYSGTTERVSVNSSGVQGNGYSSNARISANGRYVAFGSTSSNLVDGDTNRSEDIFVHDRETGVTSRVSVSSTGVEGDFLSYAPSISSDGRYVAFHSLATNLGRGTLGTYDVYVHDSVTGNTTLVSVDSGGVAGNADSRFPSISADGRYVVFTSEASNLVENDNNGSADVFVHDLESGNTVRVSVDSLGSGGNGDSVRPSISPDGRYIAFSSWASNLVTGDTNEVIDAFVHDRDTGNTARVSVDSSGTQANGISSAMEISADGQFVALYSDASNLVPGDTNAQGDIFVHDRRDGTTERVSIGSSNEQGNYPSTSASISAHGQFVAFASHATNLVSGDFNAARDVFVHERAVISNQPPEITELTPNSSDPISLDDQPVSLTVSFNDPDGSDTHLIDVSWGDGTVDTEADVTSPVALSHAYPAAGVYAVEVMVTDSAGKSDSARYEYFVIYDPDGGFVTGRGHIYSEQGWCQLDMTCQNAEGDARFGFVSRYNRGAVAPTGRTDFVFRAGSFDFQSTAYRWLIVNRNDSNAQFRGEGLVNGTTADGTAYQFMIWAGDDDPDTFGIKIWYEEGGEEEVVYETGSDQTIGGGNIKVQAK